MEDEFYGESDRAVALLQGAALDVALQGAILDKMRSDLTSDFEADLFDNGPLGTFAAKIKIAFALKAFGNKTHHDLGLIRHLRNAFAHVRKPLTFDTPQVADVCKNLWLPDIHTIAMYPKTFSGGDPTVSDMSKPRSRYLTTCHTIAVSLFSARVLP